MPRNQIQPATGTVRLSEGGTRLTITTMAKRGKKVVPLVVVYTVADLRPDPRVANPAYSLTKLIVVKAACDMSAAALESGASEELIPSEDVWHVAVDEFGPVCSCPHYTFRGSNSRVGCKHVLSMQAVGLLPKPVTYPGRKE